LGWRGPLPRRCRPRGTRIERHLEGCYRRTVRRTSIPDTSKTADGHTSALQARVTIHHVPTASRGECVTSGRPPPSTHVWLFWNRYLTRSSVGRTPARSERSRCACRARQSLRTQGTTRAGLARGSETPALASALHPDEFVVAEPRRGMVRATHQPSPPQRQLRQCRRAHRSDRPLALSLERRPTTLRLAPRENHYQESQARTRRPHPPNQIRDGPIANPKLDVPVTRRSRRFQARRCSW